MTKHHSSHFATQAIHANYHPEAHQGALTPPIQISSTYAFETVEQGGAAFQGENERFIYARLGSPSQQLLEQRFAQLEQAEAALATASGMGAITSAMWSFLKPGDELIADLSLYGCTFSFLEHGLKQFGIEVKYLNLSAAENLSRHISDKTKMVYSETPSNPNMRLIDIEALAAITNKHDCRLMIDNTYCTPYLQNPLSLGADLVVHSATKYLGGHGDLIAGFVAGKQQDIDEIRMVGLKDMTGAVISGFDVSLLLRGLKSLHVRMDRHCENAQKVADYLSNSPFVKHTFYPGLDHFPQKQLAKQQMHQAGGMIAFELDATREQSAAFVNALQMILCAVSLGDAETLIQHPASMTHSTYTEEELMAHLISPTLIRLSVGLEHIDDIIADLEQAFQSVFAADSGLTISA
ncbi:methionine gamma-lyase [Marinicella sp. S1101]|uniref:methionine gamma-lyase n=1 Tax=Marinicella marina TaxID=2996016 RepID=UPI002260E729|nr:methionine gamma-lyase [Marinicella marina]MCX7555175.1 methionine gamma-lyase [Marinicella marina]MDJ1140001.1 methionine gamma-lyase [Marinicella marina]